MWKMCNVKRVICRIYNSETKERERKKTEIILKEMKPINTDLNGYWIYSWSVFRLNFRSIASSWFYYFDLDFIRNSNLYHWLGKICCFIAEEGKKRENGIKFPFSSREYIQYKMESSIKSWALFKLTHIHTHTRRSK